MAGLASLGWSLGSGGAGIPGLAPWKWRGWYPWFGPLEVAGLVSLVWPLGSGGAGIPGLVPW
ncbi:MAG: hypothetical protein KUL83_05330, partial [Lentimicrobium sp.]|nr:hypothetical protein [Lentimicrobium sp.]